MNLKKSTHYISCFFMRSAMCLMLAGLLQQAHARPMQDSASVNIQGRNMTVAQIFNSLQQQTGYIVFYNNNILNDQRRLDVHFRHADVQEVMNFVTRGLDLNYVIKNRFILLTKKEATTTVAEPQKSSMTANPPPDTAITGTVRDEKGAALPGVSITIKGSSTGTITAADGTYSISVPDMHGILVFSFVGYTTREAAINNRQKIDMSLSPSVSSLNQLVVVGYGTEKKGDITGAQSSISADAVAKRPITQLTQALQGTASGVAVTSANGQPGQGPRVKIRGANSITGSNEPLYVTDGNIGAAPDDPNDIESIEILKDAAATAIYGSRGSNGVVLITTKSGHAGQMRVNFNTWIQQAQMPKKLHLMNAYQFANAVDSQYVHQGSAAPFSDDQLQYFKENGGTDWQDELFQKAWVKYYGLDISGGSQAVQYRVSLSYLDQPGTILNTWYKRTTFRSNLDAQLNSKMHVKMIIAASLPESHNNVYGGGLTDPFNQAVEWDPTSPLKDSAGNYISKSGYASIQFNPVEQAVNQAADSKSTNIHGNLTFTYDIFNDLTFTSTDVYSIGQNYNQNYFGPGTSNYDSKSDYISNSTSRSRSYLSSNFLTYKHAFGDHSLTATALYEVSAGKSMNFTATSKGLSTYALGYYNLSLGTTQQNASGYSADALVSYMGRINYSYKDKYYVSASLRSDGSSHLTNKWSTFPSLGLAWNATNEDFLKDSKAISLLKLRASYGKTGNQNVGAYSTIAQITTGGSQGNYYYAGGNANGAGVPSVATPLGTGVSQTLKWETKSAYDVGADIGFLKGRLEFTADAYWNTVNDLLYPHPASQYDNGGSYQANIGSISNKGVEFSVGGTPVSNSAVTWHVNLNVSINRNKVVSLGDLPDTVFLGGGNNTINDALVVGKPLGEFYGFKFLGTWKMADSAEARHVYNMQPGDAKYLDLNKDSTYSSADNVLLGNATPKFTFGFASDVSWKNFTLSFLFQGQYGSEVYSETLAYLWGGLGDMKNATTIEAVPENLWSPEHETNNPAWSNTGHNYNNSSRYVYNSSYVKLKNLSLSYDVPQTFLDRFKIRSLQLYVSGQNILVITPYKGYDPEIDDGGNAIQQGQEFGIIPNPKTYTFGIRLGL